jgi:redox-sensitive bicupin YhaK (pirin superfamily)
MILSMGIIAKDVIASVSSTQPKRRSVFKILNSTSGDMGKMGLKNIIQGDFQNYVSPFFLLDEFGPMELQAGAPFRVDAHPHAGIIPTTYLLKGNAHHRDSMDNDFEYHEGDFIQFTSGSGALHMEETGEELYRNGGAFHGFQGWLNIPPQLKHSVPNASHMKKENIALVERDNVKISVILGEVFGVKSSMQLLMPVIYWHARMKKDSSIELPIPVAQNVFIYLQEGAIKINDTHFISSGQAVLFERDGDTILINASEDASVMVFGGEVNNAPYVASGPFVLNTEKEIEQAYEDFRQGKFGDLNKTNGKKR